ncbi:MAG: alpha/beta hydrolase [Actinomycetes bacterium]
MRFDQQPWRKVVTAVSTALCLIIIASCQISNPKSFERLQLSQIPMSQPSFSLPYGTDKQQILDVYTPYGWNKNDTRPVIVHVHGGGWNGGQRADVSASMKTQLLRGWVVISVDYRLTPMVHFPEPIRDIDRAIRFVRSQAANLGIDPKQLILSGHSAGGHLVMMQAMGNAREAFVSPDLPPELVAQSSRPSGVVALGAPMDLNAWVNDGWEAIPNVLNLFLKCPSKKTTTMNCSSERLSMASVNDLIDPSDPPMYLGHGADDPIVGVEQVFIISNIAIDKGMAGKVTVDVVDSGPMDARQHFPDMGLNMKALHSFLDLAITGQMG